MKIILSIIATSLLLVFATPKKAHATEPCHVVNMCDNYVVVCDAYDYVTWDEIYCPPGDE
jgi:hypothetical protein